MVEVYFYVEVALMLTCHAMEHGWNIFEILWIDPTYPFGQEPRESIRTVKGRQKLEGDEGNHLSTTFKRTNHLSLSTQPSPSCPHDSLYKKEADWLWNPWKTKPTEKTFYWKLARWTSQILVLKTERFSCCARLPLCCRMKRSQS